MVSNFRLFHSIRFTKCKHLLDTSSRRHSFDIEQSPPVWYTFTIYRVASRSKKKVDRNSTTLGGVIVTLLRWSLTDISCVAPILPNVRSSRSPPMFRSISIHTYIYILPSCEKRQTTTKLHESNVFTHRTLIDWMDASLLITSWHTLLLDIKHLMCHRAKLN